MKKLVVLCLLLLPTLCFGQGFYVTWPQLWNFWATNTTGGGGTNIFINGSGGGLPTNSPNIFWTNNIYRAFWSTNNNFQIGEIGLPSSNFYSASITISNSGSGTITATLPTQFSAYSITMATNVVAASIAGGTALDLTFLYTGFGIYYVVDRGPNNQQLLSIASAVASSNGVLTAQSGVVNVITNVTVNTLTAQSGVFASYFQTLNGTSAGMQIVANDSLGSINLNLFSQAVASGLQVVNNSLDFVDLAQVGSSAATSSDRFEHRSARWTNSVNTTGERQFVFNGAVADTFGANFANISTPLSVNNLTIPPNGFLTNGLNIFSSRTNITLPPPGAGSSNYIYIAFPTNGQGYFFISSNGVWVKK